MERCSAFTAPLPTAVSTFPCLNNATGRISLPLPWGDPPERQVPVMRRRGSSFVRLCLHPWPRYALSKPAL